MDRAIYILLIFIGPIQFMSIQSMFGTCMSFCPCFETPLPRGLETFFCRFDDFCAL